MSANEAVAIIGPAGIAAYRERFGDVVTFFRYVTAYEGVSHGAMGKVAAKAKYWFRNAIDGVARRMNPNVRQTPVPVKLGNKHTDNNRIVGEVAGSRLVASGEGVQAEALVIFTDPALNSNPPELCSIEADVMVSELGGETGVEAVIDVEALLVSPAGAAVTGFPKATLVERINCLVDDSTGGSVMQIKDIQDALASGDITVNEVMALKPVAGQLEKAGAGDKKNRKALEAEQEANTSLREQLADRTATVNELENKVKCFESKDATREWSSKNRDHLSEWRKSQNLNLQDSEWSTIEKWTLDGFTPQGATEAEWLASLTDKAKIEVSKFSDVKPQMSGAGSSPVAVPSHSMPDNAPHNNSGVDLASAPTPLQGVIEAGARAGVPVTIQPSRG